MPTTFTVTKDTRGQWRWVAISSTAYRDRDRQIVSTKALADDVARADADGDYGPLLWWHMPGARLGDCDFNALHGRCLIESGTFRDEATAKAVAARADAQALSLGFTYPSNKLDARGVFNAIRRTERSLLPQHVASNLFTRFGVKGPTMTIDATKAAALRTLLGDDLAASILAEAAATEKAADAQGVAYKEAKPLVIDGVTYLPQSPAEPAVAAKAEGDAPVAGGISAEMQALADYIISGVAKVFATQEASGAEAAATKAADEAAARQQLEAQIATLQQQQAAALAQQQQTDTALKAAQTSLAELTQAQPRALGGGYRPSRADDTVVKEAGLPAPPPSDFDRAADFILAH